MDRRLLFRGGHIVGGVLLACCLLAYPELADWHGSVTALLAVATLLFWWRWRRSLMAPAIAAMAFLVVLIWLGLLKPRNDRDWNTETSVLPWISIVGDRVLIRGLRDFTWDENGAHESKWVNRELKLGDLQELELVVEPFGESELMAHTMLCFGFGDERIVVSVEARREQRETYGVIQGALRQFELVYLFGTERDFLTVRAVARGHRIYLYPVRADPRFIRNVFIDLVMAASDLHEQPRFYRTVRDNCTTTLVKHFDRHLTRAIGPRIDALFNARAGKLLHDLGYMRTELTYEEARQRHQVDAHVRLYANDPEFSRRLRVHE